MTDIQNQNIDLTVTVADAKRMFTSGMKSLITISRAFDFLPHVTFILLWYPLHTFTVIGARDNSLSPYLSLGSCWKEIVMVICRYTEWIRVLFSDSSEPWKATLKMAASPNQLNAPAFFSCSCCVKQGGHYTLVSVCTRCHHFNIPSSPISSSFYPIPL